MAHLYDSSVIGLQWLRVPKPISVNCRLEFWLIAYSTAVHRVTSGRTLLQTRRWRNQPDHAATIQPADGPFIRRSIIDKRSFPAVGADLLNKLQSDINLFTVTPISLHTTSGEIRLGPIQDRLDST